MRNQENSSCVVESVQNIDEEACDKAGIQSIGLLKLLTSVGLESITPSVNKVSKFEVLNFKEEAMLPGEMKKFLPSNFDANVCDNFVLELHYKIIFKAAVLGTEFKNCEPGVKYNTRNEPCCEKYDWCADNYRYQCADEVFDVVCPNFDPCKI